MEVKDKKSEMVEMTEMIKIQAQVTSRGHAGFKEEKKEMEGPTKIV